MEATIISPKTALDLVQNYPNIRMKLHTGLITFDSNDLKKLPNIVSFGPKKPTFGLAITDNDICQLKKLEELHLNHIFDITNNAIKDLIHLEKLNLSCQWISQKISDQGIMNLTKLTHLNIEFMKNNTLNKITNNGLKNLTKLTHLNLRSNDVITDDGIKDLINLTHLNLRENNNITDHGICNLKNLIYINLCHNNKITFSGLKDLPNLKAIYLFGANICLAEYAINILKEKGVIVTNSINEITKYLDDFIG